MARWGERPKVWCSEDELGHYGVGFLDLFYDLIFVVAIAQMAHGLARHIDGKHLLAFVMLLLPLRRGAGLPNTYHHSQRIRRVAWNSQAGAVFQPESTHASASVRACWVRGRPRRLDEAEEGRVARRPPRISPA
jgi:hypothetical protein